MHVILRPLIILLIVIFPLAQGAHAGYLAVSLNGLEEAVRAGRSGSDATEFAGITKVVGLVADPDGDLIIVGRCDRGLPRLQLDYLVAALRGLVERDTYPLVSLDATPETPSNGLLRVRFEGGVDGTVLGRDLLASDVFLKRLALGLAVGTALPSYLKLAADRSDVVDQIIHARFWFVPADKTLLVQREGVFVIRRLDVAVRTEIVGAATADPAAERFAQSLDAALGKLAANSPEIARVKPLFEIAALAAAIKVVRPPQALTFWLQDYRLAPVATPATFEVLRNHQAGANGRTMEAVGGIDLEVLMGDLTEADPGALRKVVLLSRPGPKSLVWPVPLAGWPTDETSTPRNHPEERAGRTALLRHAGASIVLFPASLTGAVPPVGSGGVRPGALSVGRPADLSVQRDRILEGRGSSPVWSIKP